MGDLAFDGEIQGSSVGAGLTPDTIFSIMALRLVLLPDLSNLRQVAKCLDNYKLRNMI
jgi:hypothetical protein